MCAPVDRVDAGQTRAVEELGGDGQHGQVDQPGEAERDDHVGALEPKHAGALGVVVDGHAALGERGVEIDGVRHDGRADDPDREVQGLGRAESRRQEALEAVVRGRADLEGLVEEAEEDDPEQRRDRELERAVAAAAQLEEAEGDEAGHHAGDEERDVEEQVEPERRAEELGDVGRHRDELRLHPHSPGHPARVVRRGSSRAGCWSVTIPSFADRYWISIAIRFAASTTQSRR